MFHFLCVWKIAKMKKSRGQRKAWSAVWQMTWEKPQYKMNVFDLAVLFSSDPLSLFFFCLHHFSFCNAHQWTIPPLLPYPSSPQHMGNIKHQKNAIGPHKSTESAWRSLTLSPWRLLIYLSPPGVGAHSAPKGHQSVNTMRETKKTHKGTCDRHTTLPYHLYPVTTFISPAPCSSILCILICALIRQETHEEERERAM